jgi:two-component system sensor histidine kinase/response regulator
MLRRFLADLAAAPGSLGGIASTGDAASMARLLHTVKGVAATLGADGLAAEAARGERALHAEGAPTKAGLSMSEVCTAVSAQTMAAISITTPSLLALLKALEQASEQQPPTGVEPAESSDTASHADPAALRERLRELAELLRHSDLAAVDAVARLPRPVDKALPPPSSGP